MAERPDQDLKDRKTTIPHSLADDPQFSWMLDFWFQAQRLSGAGMPPKRAIDPTAIPAEILPDIFMTDILEGGAQLRFRLVGTRIGQMGSSDPTGRSIDESYASPDWVAYMRGLYRTMIEARRPVYTENRTDARYDGPDLPRQIRRLMLPFTTDGQAVDLCLTVQTYVTARLPVAGEIPAYRAVVTPELASETVRLVL